MTTKRQFIFHRLSPARKTFTRLPNGLWFLRETFELKLINFQGCVFSFHSHVQQEICRRDVKRAIMRMILERKFQEKTSIHLRHSWKSGMWCNKFDTVFLFRGEIELFSFIFWNKKREMKNYDLDIGLERWKLHERPLRLKLNFTINASSFGSIKYEMHEKIDNVPQRKLTIRKTKNNRASWQWAAIDEWHY